MVLCSSDAGASSPMFVHDPAQGEFGTLTDTDVPVESLGWMRALGSVVGVFWGGDGIYSAIPTWLFNTGLELLKTGDYGGT
jgi:hypothetical protein